MYLILFISAVVLPLAICENILKLDITPEEAQKYISGSSSSLNYARKLEESALEPGKSAYYQGRIIEQPQNYVKEWYLANQFHGQDGLGKAKFGYTDWNQARVEDIDVHGETKGAYQYIDPNGENIKVNYWADSQGFHQTDNRPIPTLIPVTDTPEVKAARLAHEKAFAEAAAANKAPGYTPYQASGSESNYQYQRYDQTEHQNEEPTGPPRGFYYNFDYPVYLIKEKGAH